MRREYRPSSARPAASLSCPSKSQLPIEVAVYVTQRREAQLVPSKRQHQGIVLVELGDYIRLGRE